MWTIISAIIVYTTFLLEHQKNVFKTRFLIWVGNLSFELFMIHQLVIRYSAGIISFFGFRVRSWMYAFMILVSFVCAVTLQKSHRKLRLIKAEYKNKV